MGAAIAYETLALAANQGRPKKVAALLTVGSVWNLVQHIRDRRSSFELPLRNPNADDTRWVNIWARHDPVLAGPTNGNGKDRVVDVPVSNEGDPFNDHSAYWANEHQVISRLVGEIWGTDARLIFDMNTNDDWVNLDWLRRRKIRILFISGFRLAAWALFPLTVWGTLDYVNNWGFFDFLGGFQNDVANFLDQYYDWLLIGNVLFRPHSAWAYAISALAAAVVVTFAGQMAYKFVRALIWDGLLKEWMRVPKRAPETQSRSRSQTLAGIMTSLGSLRRRAWRLPRIVFVKVGKELGTLLRRLWGLPRIVFVKTR